MRDCRGGGAHGLAKCRRLGSEQDVPKRADKRTHLWPWLQPARAGLKFLLKCADGSSCWLLIRPWIDTGFALCCPTFELTGPTRQDGLARLAKMHRVPPAGPSWPAVAGPVERRVRPHLGLCRKLVLLEPVLKRGVDTCLPALTGSAEAFNDIP